MTRSGGAVVTALRAASPDSTTSTRRIAAPFQRVFDELRDVGFVFDDEDS